MVITADQARPGDVVLDGQGKEWKKTGNLPGDWSTFDGPVFRYGEWDASYGPQGELTLVIRDGRPVAG